MILLHFPFILSGDLQTKSWGLAVVLCICVCSKVVVGETTQLVHISSWTQLSNHPRLTLFSGVNAWGCLLVVKFTSKLPVVGSTLELGSKCSFSACRPLCITRCGTWWQTHPQLHHSAETGPANRTELNFAAVSDPPYWQDQLHCTKDLNKVVSSDRFSPTGSEQWVLIFPAPFIIYSLSSHSSNLWFESISCRSFVLLVYLAPHAGLLVGLSWRWCCGFTVMSQACYASAGRLPPPTDR